jgi:hypothetical protein
LNELLSKERIGSVPVGCIECRRGKSFDLRRILILLNDPDVAESSRKACPRIVVQHHDQDRRRPPALSNLVKLAELWACRRLCRRELRDFERTVTSAEEKPFRAEFGWICPDQISGFERLEEFRHQVRTAGTR